MKPREVFPSLASFARSESRALKLTILLVLLGAGWAVYGPVTGFDFITLDDPSYVYDNPALRQGLSAKGVAWAFTSLEHANWHPLTWLSLLADYQLYGLDPGGYHLTNLLLHETATLLLFAWLLFATRCLWPSAGAALLFCIHPAHVESVAWVTERKDVLSAVFFFLVLLAHTRYAQTKRVAYYLGGLLALGLGLMAKPMLVTLPPLLLLVDAWPLGRLRQRRDLLPLAIEKLPFLLIAAASCVITFIAQHDGGATISLEHLPWWFRAANTLAAYPAYLGKLFWPVNLAVFYPFADHLSTLGLTGCALGLAGATLGAVRLYGTRPWLLIGWLWFVGTLVPVIGLVQVGGQAMADRYTYLPSIGIFVALCWTLADLWRRWRRLRPALAVAMFSAAVVCLGLCQRQVEYWRDGVSLFRHTIAVTRPTSHPFLMLGDACFRSRDFSGAEVAYRRAFQMAPDDVELVTKMGILQLEQGHWEPACQWLGQVAARGDCHDPVLFNNLGFALNRLGRFNEAAPALRRSVALRPGYAFARANLGDALLGGGDEAGAADEYEKALALKPDFLAALNPLAWLYGYSDRGRDPGRAERALGLARRAVDLTMGKNVASLDALAAAEAAVNDWSGAARAAQAALRIVSDQPTSPADAMLLHAERTDAYLAQRWPPR